MALRIIELRENLNSNLFSHRKNNDARSSIVWNIFHIIIDDKGDDVDQFYYCTECTEIKYIRSDGSTTQLLRHSCVQTTDESTTKFHSKLIENLNKAAAKFICLDLRPMNAVEGEGLRELFMAGIKLGQKYPKVNALTLLNKFPSRKSVKTVITAEAHEAKQIIKAIFKSGIAEGGFGCTIDLWSDNHKHNSYMGMTANVFVSTDECIEQKRIVFNMEHITEIVKSKELIKSKIISVFNDFDISQDEIREFITFTTDR